MLQGEGLVVTVKRVALGDLELEVSDWGHGEPVVFVQTALTADELLPLAKEQLLDRYRKVVYHRPGYAGSSSLDRPGSIARDASDCHELLTVMGIPRAHVVGHSYSAAVALQLAANVPARVHTLVLMEPPPVHTPSAHEFRAANQRLRRTLHESGPERALDEFLTMVIGPNWRQAAEDRLPGSAAQMQHDAVTFFDADLPALLRWKFGREDAGRIGCPVLYVGGTHSGQWFAEVRELMRSWLPGAEDVVIAGADHSLTLTHTSQVADALSAFLRRHPMPPATIS
jgi:pimeloyl-ACP methyl ester carboxylesterase